MKPEECSNFETCSATICPFDESSIKYSYWYPCEEICKKNNPPDWVKVQRKIVKKLSKEGYVTGCFSVAMLNKKPKVTKGLKGLIGKDKPYSEQEEMWISKRVDKVQRIYTEEERRIMRENFIKRVHGK